MEPLRRTGHAFPEDLCVHVVVYTPECVVVYSPSDSFLHTRSLRKAERGCELCLFVPPPALLLTQPKPPEVQTELALDKAPLPLRGLCMTPSLFVVKVLR